MTAIKQAPVTDSCGGIVGKHKGKRVVRQRDRRNSLFNLKNMFVLKLDTKAPFSLVLVYFFARSSFFIIFCGEKHEKKKSLFCDVSAIISDTRVRARTCDSLFFLSFLSWKEGVACFWCSQEPAGPSQLLFPGALCLLCALPAAWLLWSRAGGGTRSPPWSPPGRGTGPLVAPGSAVWEGDGGGRPARPPRLGSSPCCATSGFHGITES